jgi:hypothetical protein
MRSRFSVLTAVLIALFLFSSHTFAQAPPGQRGGQRGQGGQQAGQGGGGQRAANQVVQSVPHDPHDLSGTWNKAWRTLSYTEEPPPFTAEGKKRFDANKPGYGPRAVAPALGNDPMGFCDPLGIPRNLLLEVSIYQMEMVQTPKRLFQVFEWAHSLREIWTDGRQMPKDLDPTFNGYSIGHWEGDVFVVQSAGFDDRPWLDHFGNPHSDQMTVEERYHRLDRDNMEMTITITDPVIYTRPWVSERKILRLVPNRELPELFCVPSQEQTFNRVVRDPAGGIIR